MQNHLEISSKYHFGTRNVRNLSKSLTESLRKVYGIYGIFQDLSRRTHKGLYGPIWAPTRTGPQPGHGPRTMDHTIFYGPWSLAPSSPGGLPQSPPSKCGPWTIEFQRNVNISLVHVTFLWSMVRSSKLARWSPTASPLKVRAMDHRIQEKC